MQGTPSGQDVAEEDEKEEEKSQIVFTQINVLNNFLIFLKDFLFKS